MHARVIFILTSALYLVFIIYIVSWTPYGPKLVHVSTNDFMILIYFYVLGACTYGFFEASDKNGEFRVFRAQIPAYYESMAYFRLKVRGGNGMVSITGRDL